MALLVSGIAGLVFAFVVWRLVERGRDSGLEDLTRRSGLLAHRLTPSAVEALGAHRTPEAVRTMLAPRLEGHRRLLGLAIYGESGDLVVAGEGVGEFADVLRPVVARALEAKAEVVDSVRSADLVLHVLARPLPGGKGVIAVVNDASYLEDRTTRDLARGFFWVLLGTLGVLVATVALTNWVYEGPLMKLARWMKGLRMGDASESAPPRVAVTALSEETEHLAASFRAARSSGWARSHEAVGREKAWTRERLATHATSCLAGDPLIVVSNREPYMHVLRNGETRLITPASGLVTALDPVLRSCGGVWVAHGAGEADRGSCDSSGRLVVPVGDPRYTLRRVWLSREEEQGYYYGFSNEGLWPLCHLTHERPVFRASDWEHYVAVNRRFADAALAELGTGSALVWVQDYHLALVPRMLKEARPDVRVGVFWHIPWPHAEAFRICPWGPELLDGLLGADLVGFHLQQHCNNFLDTIDRTIESRVDWDQFSVNVAGYRTLVRPFPISVQAWSERAVPTEEALSGRIEEIRERNNLDGVEVAVGVERIDYTKGLPERFEAVGRFFEKHPEFRKRFSLVQLGAPSRTHIRRYRDLVTELESLAESINWRFQEDGWKPIHFLVAHHDPATVHAFLSMGSLCIVSSLHDGMNLVAKEFVAAQEEDGDGVLVLSQFAGAARELTDAVIINPYDGEAFADALHFALTMPEHERKSRMRRMRKIVQEKNVYHWAASFLAEAVESRVPLAR